MESSENIKKIFFFEKKYGKFQKFYNKFNEPTRIYVGLVFRFKVYQIWIINLKIISWEKMRFLSALGPIQTFGPLFETFHAESRVAQWVVLDPTEKWKTLFRQWLIANEQKLDGIFPVSQIPGFLKPKCPDFLPSHSHLWWPTLNI